MMILCALLLLFLMKSETFAQSITSLQKKRFASEGEKVSLSCEYGGAVDNLHWYRQFPRSKPEFLLWIYPHGTTSDLPPRLLPKVDKSKTLVSLEIFPAEVTDSALYYCALTYSDKIVFGQGTRLFINPKEVKPPSIYKVNDSCLATDFTRHNALDGEPAFTGQNISVRYEGEKTYSAFAWGAEMDCKETGGCKEGSSAHYSQVESDEKMNFMSLGIFWLRILFLKTVVFNVLMTVKAWMS